MHEFLFKNVMHSTQMVKITPMIYILINNDSHDFIPFIKKRVLMLNLMMLLLIYLFLFCE